jgi:hypothetical protein
MLQHARHGIQTPAGETVALWAFFPTYPVTMWETSNRIALLLGVLGLALAWRRRELRWYAFGWTFFMLSLMVSPLISRTLPSFYDQIVVPPKQLLAPLAVCAAVWLLSLTGPRAGLALGAVLGGALLASSAREAVDLNRKILIAAPGSRDVNAAARLTVALAPALEESGRPSALFEVFVGTDSVAYGHMWSETVVRYAYAPMELNGTPYVKDWAPYEAVLQTRDLFALPPSRFRHNLRAQRVGLMIVHTPRAVRQAAAVMTFAGRIEDLRIYVDPSSPRLLETARRLCPAGA